MKDVLPVDLINAVKNDKLVIFIGSGLSMVAGLPNWKDLVLSFIAENKGVIEKHESYISALDSGIISPLEALDKLKANKKEIFSHIESKLKSKIGHEYHKKLGLITRKFITTNYDKLIEYNTDIDVVIDRTSSFNLCKIDTSNEYILKIHGDVSSMDNCIVFSDQYNELYAGESLSCFQLSKLFSNNTVLFIGFSFADPYVKNLFAKIAELLEGFGPKHFLLSDKDVAITNEGNLKIDCIECLNIESFNNVGGFIDKLLSIKNESSTYNVSCPIGNEEIFYEKYIDGSDIAPEVTGWVGRQDELITMDSDSHKVIFITGIGGGGKSALASYYINNQEQYSHCEWKDFKEQGHRFQQKIITLIQSVNPSASHEKLNCYSDSELIKIFFGELGDKKIVFVLDNIDSYIDFELFTPINGVGELFEMAMNSNHKSKFIFTCRPFIQYAKPRFIQLNLTGLTEQNTIDYFLNGQIPIKNDKLTEYAKKAFKLTEGHALWLTLILAQARKGESALSDFLDKISLKDIDKNDTSILSNNVLGRVWTTLNEREKLVLRTLAESVVSETEDNYANILTEELNYKNFKKALRALRGFNLIIEKRDSKYIDIHPLVRQYVISNYPPSERNKYITYFVNYYDQLVMVLRKNMSSKLSFQEFCNFTNTAELYINAKNYKDAVQNLLDVHDYMCSAGYLEEFLRVANILFRTMSWDKTSFSKIALIENLIRDTAKTSTEFGDNDLFEYLVNSYGNLIERKEDNYIRLCDIKSYNLWFNKKYAESISICEEALYLLEKAEQDDHYNIKHNLSLSLRDTGEKSNIEKALTYFLGGNSINDLLVDKIDSEKHSCILLGNVGRCLAIGGEGDKALVCFYKAFYILSCEDIHDKLLNLGYASIWIADVLVEQGIKEPFYYFFKHAINCWNSSSPLLASRSLHARASYLDNVTYKKIASQEDWRIEKYCLEWVKKQPCITCK